MSSPERSVPPTSSATRVAGIVAAVAAAGMCASCFLEWGNDVVFAASLTAKGVPLYVIWDASGTGPGMALMWPLLLCALVALAGSLWERGAKPAIAAAAGGAVLSFLFLNAVKSRLSDGFDDFGSASMGKAVGLGAWVYAGLSLVVLVALIVRLRLRGLAASPDPAAPISPSESTAQG